MQPLARIATAVVFIAITGSHPASLAQQPAANPAPKPPPDVILFTNGDRLTGALERAVGGSVVFKSDVVGEITVPLDKVKELKSAAPFTVLRSDRPVTQKPVTSGALALADKTVTVETASGAHEAIPTAKIGYIIDQATYERELEKQPGLLYGWHGAVNGGATIVRSTDYGETYTAGIALVRAVPSVPWLPARNRTSFDLQETYGKLTSPVIPQTAPPTPAAVTVTSIFHADAERDEYFSPAFFALAQTAFDHNYGQGLSLQQVYGGGIGWTTLKSGKQELDLKATIQFEKQDFQTAANNKNLIGSTLAEAYHRNLPLKLVFTEALSVLPAFNNSSAYSANASAGLAMPVFKRLSLSIGATDTYLNDPSAGYQKNSFQFMTAAAYSLK
jgi:hypothetical protein